MVEKMICCESIASHDKHICQLVTKASAGEIIDLVELPNFICENCARVANSSENICRPKNLNDIRNQK